MAEEVTKISFRISAEEKSALLEYAETQDLTISQVVRKAIKQFLEKEALENKNQK